MTYDEEIEKALGAMQLSAQSIVADDGLTTLQKQQALAASFEQFTDYIAKLDAADDDGDQAMADTEDPALCDMSDHERKVAEMKMQHERAQRMRGRLHKQGEDDMDEMIAIAKRVAHGAPTRITKAQWHAEITKRAAAYRDVNETPEQAYTRFLTETADGNALYQAYKLAPQDEQAEPVAVTPPTPTPTRSYERLTAKANELRKAEPKLSEAQAFTKVYEDPANRELVQAAKLERTEQYGSTSTIAELRKREAGRAA
jgi:hypothetical protein